MSLNREFSSDCNLHHKWQHPKTVQLLFWLWHESQNILTSFTVWSKNIENKMVNYWYHLILLLFCCFRITVEHIISWWQNVNTEVLKCQLATVLLCVVILNGYVFLNICWGCFVTVSIHAYIKCLSFPFVNFSCCASQ